MWIIKHVSILCFRQYSGKEATDDSEHTMSIARDGGTHRETSIDPKMMIDIQKQVSRLVAKAGQLIGNFTTNLAESWMHMRTKFDGGKL